LLLASTVLKSTFLSNRLCDVVVFELMAACITVAVVSDDGRLISIVYFLLLGKVMVGAVNVNRILEMIWTSIKKYKRL
jgi:hypothetical protein